jgi:hypothetical protein
MKTPIDARGAEGFRQENFVSSLANANERRQRTAEAAFEQSNEAPDWGRALMLAQALGHQASEIRLRPRMEAGILNTVQCN